MKKDRLGWQVTPVGPQVFSNALQIGSVKRQNGLPVKGGHWLKVANSPTVFLGLFRRAIGGNGRNGGTRRPVKNATLKYECY